MGQRNKWHFYKRSLLVNVTDGFNAILLEAKRALLRTVTYTPDSASEECAFPFAMDPVFIMSSINL